MVLNVYTGTENNTAHRLCITVLHDMQIVDENCSTMAGIILDWMKYEFNYLGRKDNNAFYTYIIMHFFLISLYDFK